MQTTTLSTTLHQLRGILAAIRAPDGVTALSHILSSQPYAWPLVTHLCPTDTGINDDETYGNVALPTPSCEYYVHALGADVKATVSMYNPGEENGILFCNVAAYDVHGNPVLMPDTDYEEDDNIHTKQRKTTQQYDQVAPLPGETASKTWTGPIILVARYYKCEHLRSKWVTEKEWSLPTVMIHCTENEQQRKLLPTASAEQQQRFTTMIGPYLKRSVANVAPKVRLEQSATLELSVNDGEGLFPNPRSYYSYFNPNFNQLSSPDHDASYHEQPIGVRICMTLPSYETMDDLGILFGDIMIGDMYSTRTDASLPSDCIKGSTDGMAHGTCWGKEFTVYVLLAYADIPLEITTALDEDTNTFLLQWKPDTIVPSIVYRLVVERDLDTEEEYQLKDVLTGHKNDISLDWVYR